MIPANAAYRPARPKAEDQVPDTMTVEATAMPEPDTAGATPPVVAAFAFDGEGRARRLGAADLLDLPAGGAFCWVHVDLTAEGAEDWLLRHGIDGFVCSVLLAPETRPRCTMHGEGALLILRGIDMGPDAEVGDMVALRLWISSKRVVSVSARPMVLIHEIEEAAQRHHAPVSPGDLVGRLAIRLSDVVAPVVGLLNEQIDDLEEDVLDDDLDLERGQLAQIRRSSIMLRRYMFPQRDALVTLEIEEADWLGTRDRHRLREAAEAVTRLSEELDAIRDRAQIVHDQIMDRRSETMNRQMLILSVISGIFLPLGLVAGVLGMNVGGIPGEHSGWAFPATLGLLAVIAAFQVWLFRRMGLFRL